MGVICPQRGRINIDYCLMERVLLPKNTILNDIDDFDLLNLFICKVMSDYVPLQSISEISHCTMEPSTDNTEKPKPKLPLLAIEEKVFLDVILTSNGADVIAKRILAVIKNDEEVCDNLKTLYRQGLFGKDAKVKRRLRNRIYAMKRLHK